jgi:predicted dehydrogenase
MHRSGDYRTSYRDQWRHFIDCVRRGAPVEASLDEARPSMLAMLAGMESARLGQAVAVTEVRSG